MGKSGNRKCCREKQERERKQVFFTFAGSSSERLIAQFYKFNFIFCWLSMCCWAVLEYGIDIAYTLFTLLVLYIYIQPLPYKLW